MPSSKAEHAQLVQLLHAHKAGRHGCWRRRNSQTAAATAETSQHGHVRRFQKLLRVSFAGVAHRYVRTAATHECFFVTRSQRTCSCETSHWWPCFRRSTPSSCRTTPSSHSSLASCGQTSSAAGQGSMIVQAAHDPSCRSSVASCCRTAPSRHASRGMCHARMLAMA